MDNENENNDLSTLEDQGTVASPDGDSANPTPNPDKKDQNKSKKKRKLSLLDLISRINVYFLFFLLIIAVAGLIVYIGYQREQDDGDPTAETQTLSPEELEEISATDTLIGDPQQLLTVESNTVFSGQVLVRDSLEVAGPISVGGDLSLPGITVSGTSNFEEVQASSLSVASDTNIQGQLVIDGSFTAGSDGSFGGNLTAPLITTDTLQLTGDLQITRHIETGGPSPTASSGVGIGSGGTVSISGSDTAGTITVNPGGGAGNGPVATVSFANSFNQTPHVVVTPIGRYVEFYVTRTTSGFTIHVTQSLSPGSFSLDYIAFD